jgi:hypothetical protein
MWLEFHSLIGLQSNINLRCHLLLKTTFNHRYLWTGPYMMPLIAPPPFYLYFFNIDFFSMYTTFCNFLCITEWHIYNKYNQTVVSIHTGFLTYMYDPDSSPSLSYIWSWFFPFMHCLIYDPDSSPSLLYMTKNNWNLSFIHYFFILPFMGHLYIAWQFPLYREESWYSRYIIIFNNYWSIITN